MARLLGKFVPDVKPVTIVFVDSLATDFYFYVADQYVTYVVDPAEAVAVLSGAFNERKSYL